tara:strand:+ start:469 stop:1428 length:960 start_codon:yes stop_codon:yes gene_type:complete
MALTTRQELIDYSLRRLGFPVIEINVDDDQISDRVDDAIQLWQEHHFDGVERVYIKKALEGTTLNLTSSATFNAGEKITGGTSGAEAIVDKSSSGTKVIYENVTTVEKFAANETITGADSGTTATISSIVKGNIENGYIDIADNILGVTRMFKFGGIGSTSNSDGLFDIDYQFAQNDLYNLLAADVTYYSMVKTHMNVLESLFVNDRAIRFNRKTNKLYIDTDMDRTFNIGDYVIAEGYALVAGADYAEVYDDMWLKKYTTALIKRQWGENMKKFGGIQLPGGVTLNGDQIYSEAVNEIAQIEEEMQNRYELPPTFMTG